MEALTRYTRNAFQCTCFIWLLFLIALNTKAATISLNTNISVDKHYSSLKPHFTLTILPPSPPVFHFAAFWSPFAPHGESRTLQMSCLTLLKTKKAQKVWKAPKELLRGSRRILKTIYLFRRKYITFAVPIENEVRRIDQNGEKNTKNISYILQLIKSAKLKQVLCQILLIIYLKDFIELNVN